MTQQIDAAPVGGQGPRPLGPRPLGSRPLGSRPSLDLPEPFSYRLKCMLLGKPLHTERLEHERLGKPLALAVFASDNLSSSAYATEEILHVAVPAFGLLAFSLVVPITIAMLVVLALLILSYRQTIKEYPTAGGAYIVTRDNFGLMPAQVAGVALLTDYVLTVSVSIAAGVAALVSTFPGLGSARVPLCLLFIAVIAYGNLRGVRESGMVFAVPTYFFIANMVALIAIGLYRYFFGSLPLADHAAKGIVAVGTDKLLWSFAVAWIVMKAFASGGAAVTGVEAISNGVPAFRKPEWRNARTTLVIMGSTLGFMFLVLSILAVRMQVMPFENGLPTVISQIGRLVYDGYGGTALWVSLNVGTFLILVMAANTSYADFPRLASFHAGDNFMPKQLTKRGHRLVYSNGIIALSAAAGLLVVVTRAEVTNLIGMYAIGVFLSFTMSQAGMARHHVRKKEPGWRGGLVVNGIGAVVSGIVCLVIAFVKFSSGAWVVILLVPVMVWLLTRLNRQYESEIHELGHEVANAVGERILKYHTVLVLVDKASRATALGIKYGRALMPDELRCVHIAVDPAEAKELIAFWRELPTSRVPLQIVDCPDRRIAHSVAETVVEAVADGETEVSVLISRREYRRLWHRLLHDRTANEIAEAVAHIPHAKVTFVPYHLGQMVRLDFEPELTAVHPEDSAQPRQPTAKAVRTAAQTNSEVVRADGTTPIESVNKKQRIKARGRVVSIRVRPWNVSTDLELTIQDDTGRILAIFNGRKQLAGVDLGTHIELEGIVGELRGRLVLRNPIYTLLMAENVAALGSPGVSRQRKGRTGCH